MSDKPTYMKHMPHFLGPVAPITIDHAEGSWVYDTDGGKWLDFVVGIAVVNTGHCHPKVVKAVQEQAAKVAHAQMNIYRHGPMLELAEKLTEIMPEGMDEVMFANSGAEAVENAVKLAKQATRRPGIIAFQGAFHGRTHLTMALTDSAVHYRGHHEPLVGSIYHARYCYPYRTPASEDPTAYAIEDLRRVLRAEIYGDDVASIIVEPIQGEGGFIVPTDEFMQELRAIADEIGACLIIDEIQAGFGRTGKWFCHEHYGVKADIVTVAKGIASGYPLGAIVASHELWDKCLPGSMGGTYGGNAVACAAGVATMDAMKDEGMLENADAARARSCAPSSPGHAGDVPVHRRGRAARASWTPSSASAGHQGAQRGRRQGVHRRVQQAQPHPHGRRLLRATASASCRRSTSATPTWTYAFGIFDEAAKVAFA